MKPGKTVEGELYLRFTDGSRVEDSSHFQLSFRDCPKSIVDGANAVADTFDVIAEGYAATVQNGKTAWRLVSKGENASSEAELKQINAEINTLRVKMAEQTVDMERRNSMLPQIAVLVFGSVIGNSSNKDKVALLLSEKDKQKVISEITRLCAGQCVFKAGTEYPYAAVGLILNKLQEAFLLKGTPFEK